MNTRVLKRGAPFAGGLLMIALVLFTPAARGQFDEAMTLPLYESDFAQAAPRGFGDRANGWPQSMVWWKGRLYVGTGRQPICTALFSLHQFVAGLVSQEFADTWLPYPPLDPDMSCAPDGADLSLQAEIWRWTPTQGLNGVWERVFQSPLDLDNPGTGPPAPPRTGKKLPYEITFRGLAAHTERDGTEALYAFGVNSTVMWDRNQLPPPRILRTTDGVNWQPLPQDPGTFLHDLPFNPDHSSFRSPESFKGKLFVLSGPIFGQGSLIVSEDPEDGNDSWSLAAPAEQLYYEIESFNGHLYIGSFDPELGYSVLKTPADGPPPYQFTTVVPPGAYLANRPSGSVVSMRVSAGRLYVGTATQTEIIRINPDDTWDLVIGQPRQAPSPNGGLEWKYPISGLDAGFGHTLNDHAWQVADPYGHIYVGTYNASTGSRLNPQAGPQLLHNMGAHLYRTPDSGWHFSPVTTNGFARLGDPQGGLFDYGIRTMESTPSGFFMGAVNDHFGLMIYRAATRSAPAVRPPGTLEVEQIRSGGALLSWDTTSRAKTFRVWRAEIRPILVRDDVNFELWNGISGNKIPDTYITEYQMIGQTQKESFIDSTVQPDRRYMYYVQAVLDPRGRVSDPSNLVTFPLLNPSVTFAQLLGDVERLQQRNRLLTAQGLTSLQNHLLETRALAAACNLAGAIERIQPKEAASHVKEPEAIDVGVLFYKLERRLKLFAEYPLEVVSQEICTGGAN